MSKHNNMSAKRFRVQSFLETNQHKLHPLSLVCIERYRGKWVVITGSDHTKQELNLLAHNNAMSMVKLCSTITNKVRSVTTVLQSREKLNSSYLLTLFIVSSSFDTSVKSFSSKVVGNMLYILKHTTNHTGQRY